MNEKTSITIIYSNGQYENQRQHHSDYHLTTSQNMCLGQMTKIGYNTNIVARDKSLDLWSIPEIKFEIYQFR
jgi:hypothetical protein